MSSSSAVVDLNVGGTAYSASRETLSRCPVLGELLDGGPRDSQGRVFVDRDGALFRFILDFLRSGRLLLPEEFRELARLKDEAQHFRLDALVTCLSATSALPAPFPGQPGYITLGYRGTFAFGRDGLADVKFRKLTRILICGKVTMCREVFGDTLNESRDPDRGQDDRYTSRFFLKHNSLEQAFDCLQESRFRCVCACWHRHLVRRRKRAAQAGRRLGGEPLEPLQRVCVCAPLRNTGERERGCPGARGPFAAQLGRCDGGGGAGRFPDQRSISFVFSGQHRLLRLPRSPACGAMTDG
ncbi:hypothetical protein HPB49_022099 [Dermacentor silvarum]|uniref:Uncharacterized protein n=1 Tax=Dermacentor silvarum TaxID=543639 RepID=A0ACB8D0B8_DERSI|nr:hypothetical protein HPB49_022099 [Dermacentor silvarum]